jgi:hypothetical protein
MSGEGPAYVYGVIAGRAPAAACTGIDGQPLRAVTADGLGAIVSDVAGRAPTFGRDALLAHSKALEALLEETTVLPMRFGVIMDGDAAVRGELLEPHRDELLAQLGRLDGRVELSLRATYEEAPLLREIMATEPQIRALHAASTGSYLEHVQLGEMIAGAVEARRRRDAEEIMGVLAPLAEDFQLATPRHERMALSASFLIPREEIAGFDAAVDDIGRRHGHRLRLRYTGPLPPHSFVNLEQVR